MKNTKKKLAIIAITSIFIFSTNIFKNDVKAEFKKNDKFYNTDATTSVTIVRTYRKKSSIPNAIWMEKDGCVGYVYRRHIKTKTDDEGRYYYEVIFSGTLLRGPYVPSNKKEKGEKI